MFRPLFDAVRDVLAREELIPAAGGYHRADDVRLASGAELHDCSAPVSSVRCSVPPVRSSSRIRPSPST